MCRPYVDGLAAAAALAAQPCGVAVERFGASVPGLKANDGTCEAEQDAQAHAGVGAGTLAVHCGDPGLPMGLSVQQVIAHQVDGAFPGCPLLQATRQLAVWNLLQTTEDQERCSTVVSRCT